MITFNVHLVVTPEDQARAKAIRESEAEEHKRAPEFMRDGKGLCRTMGDPDDFTRMERRSNADFEARARAKAICDACPLRIGCLAWAMETGQDGVFGGEWLLRGIPQMTRRPSRNVA